jgi:hypothetical protein
MNKFLAILALLLAGCEPSELRFAPIAPIGGGGSSAPAPARPAATPLAPGAHRMMQDPEAQEDSGIQVIASSTTQANNRCEEIARNLSDRQTIVTCLGCRQRTKTNNKYICTIRTESRLPPSEERR